MKIALLGYGKMGKIIENITTGTNVEVLAHYDEFQPFEIDKVDQRIISDVDVFIDFSIPDAVFENIKTVASISKNIVIGTTGWHDKIGDVAQIVKNSKIGLIYGSNFSLGVNIFFKVIDYASSLFSRFDNYDTYIDEAHHKMKKDAPSGTALVLKKIMAKHYSEENISVNSIRAGYIPGSHSVNFDSAVDTIKIEHVARSRQGFAEGALLAAQWIKGKSGFYEFLDVIDDILK